MTTGSEALPFSPCVSCLTDLNLKIRLFGSSRRLVTADAAFLSLTSRGGGGFNRGAEPEQHISAVR